MEIQTRHDIIEPGDLSALVCIDEPAIQRKAVEQIALLGYKIHTGLFAEDISLKLKAHAYDLVAVYENFNDADVASNPVLHETFHLPSAQRRRLFLVLIGPGMITNNEMQAFACSVDLVFSVSDLPNLVPVLRRGAARHKEFYQLYEEALKVVDTF